MTHFFFFFASTVLSTFHQVENEEETQLTEIMNKTEPMSNGPLCLSCVTWAHKEELTWARQTWHSTASVNKLIFPVL